MKYIYTLIPLLLLASCWGSDKSNSGSEQTAESDSCVAAGVDNSTHDEDFYAQQNLNMEEARKHLVTYEDLMELQTNDAKYTYCADCGNEFTLEKKNIDTTKAPFSMDAEKHPFAIDYQQDLSKLSYTELLMLREFPYAMHGYWFMEEYLNNYFRTKTNWYTDAALVLVSRFPNPEKDEAYGWFVGYGMHGHPSDRSQVMLSAQETEFIAKIDRRIAEIEEERLVDVEGVKLLNTNMVANRFLVEKSHRDELFKHLARQNFALKRTDCIQLFNIYEENEYLCMPNYITTDLFLHAYYAYFTYEMKRCELFYFLPMMTDFCESLHKQSRNIAMEHPELADLADWNTTFFAVALNQMDGRNVEVPDKYKSMYAAECQNINSASDNPSDFLGYSEDPFPYNKFKPVGHYSYNDTLRHYFKAMMWLQFVPFCQNDETQLKRTIFMAQMYNHADKSTQENLKLFNDAISNFMGDMDNVGVLDIAKILKELNIRDFSQTFTQSSINKINAEITKVAQGRNRIKPLIELTCPDKINFMPQRYMPDNEVLGSILDTSALPSKRMMPKGLDVFAAFGVKSAETILTDFYREKENWNGFAPKLEEKKQQFAQYRDWNKNLYNRWLDCLVKMQQTKKEYPGMMQTKAWELKNLNTALASWTQLQHLAALYKEEPAFAEYGGGEPILPSPDIFVGSVEPNVEFWKLLKKNIQSLNDIVGKFSEKTNDNASCLLSMVDSCLVISNNILNGIPISKSQLAWIEGIDYNMEEFMLDVTKSPDSEHGYSSWQEIKGPDRSVALTSTIYTNPLEEKNPFLHAATGNASAIYVLVDVNGKTFLARGATYDYREFVHSGRLDDSEWQKMLEENKEKGVQKWMQPLYLDASVKVDERVTVNRYADPFR